MRSGRSHCDPVLSIKHTLHCPENTRAAVGRVRGDGGGPPHTHRTGDTRTNTLTHTHAHAHTLTHTHTHAHGDGSHISGALVIGLAQRDVGGIHTASLVLLRQ